MEKNEDRKRRLNFISGEDFYFLTYELMLLLDVFTAKSGTFKDHRKLAYLVHLIGDESIMSVLTRYQQRKVANAEDRERLFSTFAAGEMHKREIYKLIFALERRGLLVLHRAAIPEVIDIEIVRNALPASFLESDMFSSDRDRASRLKKLVPRISTLSTETFLQKIYGDRGVNVWAL